MALPTIGRILHFYDLDADTGDTHRKGVEINGQGIGPFPGIVTQVYSDRMVSLRCFAYGGEFTESSVDLVDHPEDGRERGLGRFCIWPPHAAAEPTSPVAESTIGDGA